MIVGKSFFFIFLCARVKGLTCEFASVQFYHFLLFRAKCVSKVGFHFLDFIYLVSFEYHSDLQFAAFVKAFVF